jgi:hypothetical protein
MRISSSIFQKQCCKKHLEEHYKSHITILRYITKSRGSLAFQVNINSVLFKYVPRIGTINYF